MAENISQLGKGWTTEGLIKVVYFFLCCSFGSVFLTYFFGADLVQLPLGSLTLALLLEVISWAAIPIIAFLVVFSLKRGAQIQKMIGWSAALAVLSEIPYDLVYGQSAFDFTSQNLVWAIFVSLIVIYARQRFAAQQVALRLMGMGLIYVAGFFWLLVLHIGTRFAVAPLGLIMAAFIGIFYVSWGLENRMMLSAGFLGALFFIAPALGVGILHYRAPRFDIAGKIPHWTCGIYYPLFLLVFAGIMRIFLLL